MMGDMEVELELSNGDGYDIFGELVVFVFVFVLVLVLVVFVLVLYVSVV